MLYICFILFSQNRDYMSVLQDQDLSLSLEALAALKDFALDNCIDINTSDENDLDIRRAVQENYRVVDKEEEFVYEYGDEIEIILHGWKKELGQTLDSTGLTVWRAAEDLAKYLFVKKDDIFDAPKTVLELGSGLGLCGLLAAYINPNGKIVITDGDEVTMEKLHANLECNPICNGCKVSAELLYWGRDMESFIDKYPTGFDVIIAADVIYIEEAIKPLLDTAKSLMMKQSSIFYLSFARRSVSINLVLDYAKEIGLSYEIDGSFECSLPEEHIYIFRK